MDNVSKLLLVEDNPGDARLIQEMLSEVETTKFEVVHEVSLQDALKRLSAGTFDVILLDLGLPDSHGLDTFTSVYAQTPDVPIVVMSGFDDESFAIKAVRQGAQDYLVKGRIESSLLVRAIRYASERKRLLMELKESQQKELQVKNQFLSYVSHELRSPLTALYQFITILLDGLAGEVSPEQRQYLEISLNKIKELQSLVGDLRDASRSQTGKLSLELKQVSLPKLIDETIKSYQMRASEKGISLDSKIQDNLPTVYVDPERVVQIVSNLIDNAIKFTPENGTITVEAKAIREDPDFVRISVTDTGCGIAPEEHEKIFEYQYQVKGTSKGAAAGLGLGLYICKELTLRHGGRIWVESRAGQGSTFFFTLPTQTG